MELHKTKMGLELRLEESKTKIETSYVVLANEQTGRLQVTQLPFDGQKKKHLFYELLGITQDVG